MKILYYYSEEWEKEYVQGKLSGQEITFVQGRVQDTAPTNADVEVLSIFVNSAVTKETIAALPALKLIVTRSTGYDHIDRAAAKERGVQIASVPTYGENTVAEFAFALLLALSRRIYDSYERIVRTGSFSQENLRGFDLKGKTIGVVGTGHIGLNSIRIAGGFGMKVVAFDVHQNADAARDLNFTYVTFDELLAQSDVITIHVPYNEHTHHMINRESIQKIKKGAFLINTARGGLIETGALVEALEKGIIAGAGLDVLEEEGYLADELSLLNDPHPKVEDLKAMLANHYFIDHPHVIVTPHNAFNTTEAITRILDTTIGNITAFSSGTPTNIVSV